MLLYLVAIKHPSKVKAVVYVREDLSEPILFTHFVNSFNLSPLERDVIASIKKPGEVSLYNLSKQLNKSTFQLTRLVNDLEDNGILITERKKRYRYVRLGPVY